MMNKNAVMYPELMSEKQLAEAFRGLEEQIDQELFSCIRDPKKRVALLEQLTESSNVRRCAILLMLRRHAGKLRSETRQFLLPHLVDLVSDDSGVVRIGAQDCAGSSLSAGTPPGRGTKRSGRAMP